MTGTPTVSPETLDRLRKLAWFLDNALRVPGTRFRIGLDSLLGLIPGAGDVVGAAVSGYLLHTAWKHDVPKEIVARMLANIATDLVVGAVPFLGDLFDAAWKANSRNVALLERALKDNGSAR